MNLRMPQKKILAPGLQLVTIKGCAVARNDKGVPASWIDSDDHQKPKGAMRVLFMGKGLFGIEHDFWLGTPHLKRAHKLCEAIGVKWPVHKDSVIGKKLYVLIAKVLIFDGNSARIGEDGTQAWIPKLIPQSSDGADCFFWPAAEYPSVIGDPLKNGGVCSGEFLWHYSGGRYFVAPQKSVSVEEIEETILKRQYEQQQPPRKRFGQ